MSNITVITLNKFGKNGRGVVAYTYFYFVNYKLT